MTASMELPVQPKIARDLEVGDYVRVIDKGAPLTEAPDLFRRVEHIRFAADAPPDSANIVTVRLVPRRLALPRLPGRGRRGVGQCARRPPEKR
jgi:hypothetical protein